MSNLNLIPDAPPSPEDIAALQKLISSSARRLDARLRQSEAVAAETARRKQLPPARREELERHDRAITAARAEQEYWRAVHKTTPATIARNREEDEQAGETGHESGRDARDYEGSHADQCVQALHDHLVTELSRMDHPKLKRLYESIKTDLEKCAAEHFPHVHLNQLDEDETAV